MIVGPIIQFVYFFQIELFISFVKYTEPQQCYKTQYNRTRIQFQTHFDYNILEFQ